MLRQPPISTRTVPLVPYTTLIRSPLLQSCTPRDEALLLERFQPRALPELNEMKSSRLKPLPQKPIPWTGWHRCLGRPGDPGRALAPGLVQEAQELGARARILAEAAEHLRRHHAHPALVDAARGHAFVGGLDHHADAAWLEHAFDHRGDLRGHLFLHLEAARIGFDHARKLADAHHLAVGQVAAVGLAADRRPVVFAEIGRASGRERVCQSVYN